MKCAECSEDRPPEQFYADNSRPRGRVARCKDCYRRKAQVTRLRPRRLFLEAKSNAVRRGFDWRLSYDDYELYFVGAPCFYCGDDSRPHGLDRLNNEPFYDLTNAVACCADCNGMKSKRPFHEFLTRVLKIAGNLTLPETAHASVALMKGQF